MNTSTDVTAAPIKCDTEPDAIARAIEERKKQAWPPVHVIESRGAFYVERGSPFVRSWERVVWEDGKRR